MCQSDNEILKTAKQLSLEIMCCDPSERNAKILAAHAFALSVGDKDSADMILLMAAFYSCGRGDGAKIEIAALANNNASDDARDSKPQMAPINAKEDVIEELRKEITGHVEQAIQPTVPNPSHIVICVPGIRDFASRWQDTARSILELDSSATMVVGVRFGFYDVLSFAAPIDMSESPYGKVIKAYDNAVENFPTARISFVAHSFGTFLVGRFLQENREARVHKLLLCGAVIREDFEWAEVASRFPADAAPLRSRILNECGTSDIWPMVAKALSKRYGHAGRHGLDDTIYTTSVYYNGGHSLFFSEQHIRTAWKGYLEHGQIPKGNAQAPDATLFERAINLPFANLVFRLYVWVLWLLLFLWPVTLTAAVVAGCIYSYSHPSRISHDGGDS